VDVRERCARPNEKRVDEAAIAQPCRSGSGSRDRLRVAAVPRHMRARLLPLEGRAAGGAGRESGERRRGAGESSAGAERAPVRAKLSAEGLRRADRVVWRDGPAPLFRRRVRQDRARAFAPGDGVIPHLKPRPRGASVRHNTLFQNLHPPRESRTAMQAVLLVGNRYSRILSRVWRPVLAQGDHRILAPSRGLLQASTPWQGADVAIRTRWQTGPPIDRAASAVKRVMW